MRVWSLGVLLVLVGVVYSQDAYNLVKEMTMDEKYSIVEGIGWVGSDPITDPHYYYVGNTPGVDRLNIPSYNMQDGPQGFRTYQPEQVDEVTAWPSSLSAASTFDPSLIYRWTAAMAQEFKGKGANMILGPCVDVGRVPRAGRAGESLSGEDPVLGGRLGVEYVKGVQDQKVMACGKHFTVYNQETIRDDYDAQVETDTLFNVYYRPIRSVIDKGDVASVMCSYNLVNGVHACDNPSTLKRDLKLRMEFTGFVMSDWYAVHSPDAAEAGLDMEQPGDPNGNGEGPYFTPSILSTHASNQTINDMAYRIVNALIKVGAFNTTVCSPPDCDDLYLSTTVTSPYNQNLAGYIATEATILLKNSRKTLPLPPASDLKKIAIVGSACDAPAPTSLDDPNLDWTNGTYYWIGGSGRVMSSRTKSFLDGMKEVYGEELLAVDLSDNVESSAETMKGADVAFVCGGATASESFDRASLSLNEERFMTEMAEKKGTTPLVGVVLAPGTVVLPFREKMDALVMLIFGGEATGGALAKVVSGGAEPGGRLPVSILNELGVKGMVEPCQEGEKCVYSEGVNVGYVGLKEDEVAFSFGHGLSYTTFEYKKNSTVCHPKDHEVACFYVEITNTGDREGSDVVQAYLRYPDAPKMQRILKDFHKVFLSPGEKETVQISLERDVVEVWQEWGEGGFYIPFGEYHVSIGPSSGDTKIEETFSV